MTIEIDRAAAYEHVGDLKGLLACVGLADEDLFGVDAQTRCVAGVEGVLGIDERCDPAECLRLGEYLESERGLAGGLGSVDLDDPSPRDAPDAECGVEGERSRGYRRNRNHLLIAQTHERALAELAVDRLTSDVDDLDFVGIHGHALLMLRCRTHATLARTYTNVCSMSTRTADGYLGKALIGCSGTGERALVERSLKH